MTTPNKNPVADFRSGEDCRSQAEAKPRGSRRHLIRLHSDGVRGPRGAKPSREKGFTLIEVLVGLGILAVVTTGIYQAYGSVLEIIQSAQYNSAALSIIETQVEMVRNMRYEDVGTVGGVPTGLLPQQEVVTLDGISFTMHNYVRNIDDPFDGTLGGSPGDTAPADYKLVEFQITCDECTRYNITTMATYVAPKNLESASQNGNLFVRVFDADGQPIAGATVHVTNTQVSPPINLTDITNAAGMLQLVDTATSSAGYHIVVTKSGYSSDQTYPPGTPPNPLQPDATVATQQLTITSLAIDRLSTLTLRARDQSCAPTGGMDLLATGGKLIGTSPDTPKYSQSHATNAAGTATLNLEWDTYAFKPTDTTWDIAGVVATSALNLTINPDTDHTITWQTASRSANGLLVSVADGSGSLLNDATVRVTGPGGYDRTVITGQASLTDTDWSGGAYASKSDTIEADDQITLTGLGLLGGSGSLTSETMDLATSSVTFLDLRWQPTLQPPLTTLRFQLAGNNDNATWNYVGPDGTAGSFFTNSGTTIPSALNSKRYLRYRAYLDSPAAALTPSVADVTVGFRSGCMIDGQAYFNGLGTGTYSVTVTRSGFSNSTTTKSVIDSWQRHTITLSP